MSANLRLITDESTIYYASVEGNYLIEQKGAYIVPKPKGKSLILGFIQHTQSNSKQTHILAVEAAKRNIGTVYLCDKLPDNPVISPYIVYVKVQWKWFIHTLFFNPLAFKGCFYSEGFKRLAKAFSSFTKYQIPVLESLDAIVPFSKESVSSSNSVVVEIMGGLGDHLLCIPAIKTLNYLGKKVSVLCDEHLKPCFDNIPYIKEFYAKRESVDVSKFDKILNLNFGQLLNDYRLDLNKQNRIYSVADVCGIRKEDLKYDVPEIILSKEESEEASKLYSGSSKKIFFGWDSNRSDTRIPKGIAQKIITRLKKQGFIVYISSLREADLVDCVNLNKKLNLRQLFMLISRMDSVLTVDSSFLHIAAAFNIKTFVLMNYFDPSWRCSTYRNVVAYTPKVKCYPCVSGQYVCGNDRVCSGKDTCFNYFNWDTILSDIYKYFSLVKSDKESINEDIRRTQDISCSSIYRKKGLKLLLNRTSGFGDILMVTSVVNTVKKMNPDSSITVRTNHPKILEGITSIDKVIGTKFAHVDDLSTFSKDYDSIIDLQYAVESKKVSGAYGKITEDEYMSESRIDLLHKFSGLPKSNTVELSYEVTREEKIYAKKTIGKLKHKNTVVIAVNSTSAFRTYPIDLCIDTIKKLIVNYNVICLGNIDALWGNTEHPFNKYYLKNIKKLNKNYFLNLVDKSSIRQACAIIAESDILIAPDSGLLHVANAVGTKAIALFGNIDPYLRCSFYGNTVCMSKNLRCLCGDRFYIMKFTCPSFSGVNSKEVRRVGADCMRFIKPDDIVKNVDIIISPDKDMEINYRDLLLPFCEGRGVILGNSYSKKINKRDIILDNVNNLEKLNLLDANYICLDNYLTSLASEYKLIETLVKAFEFVNYNGTVVIKNKIPFITDSVVNDYHNNFCLLYIKQLLKRSNIKYEEVHKIDLLDNGEFILVLRRLG